MAEASEHAFAAQVVEIEALRRALETERRLVELLRAEIGTLRRVHREEVERVREEYGGPVSASVRRRLEQQVPRAPGEVEYGG